MTVTVAREWSIFQGNIFSFVEFDTGNAIVEAVAGSGKTTTLVEAMRRALGRVIFLAFNKAIQLELESRGVNSKTFHSLCYRVVTQHKRAHKIETNKLFKLVDSHMTADDGALYGSFIRKLVSLARQTGIGAGLVNDEESEWLKLVDHYDLELDNEKAQMPVAIDFARKLLQWSNASNMVDFDDLLYIAVKDGLTLEKYDFVFVDEAQDTNAIQRAILRKIMKPTTRLIAVGDPAQAIYGFRGADSNSMNLIATEFNCKILPLSYTYRCGTQIVKYAQQWVSHIQAAPGAHAGEVIQKGTEWTGMDFQINDLVVCRTTKPLITLAYKLLKDRRPVVIMGREIGEGLISLIKKMNAKGIDNLVKKLDIWRDREVEKALAKKDEAKCEAIHDKADAIMVIIDGMPETDRTVPALIEVLNTLYPSVQKDKDGREVKRTNVITLSTIHRAKGLEAETVYWLNSSKCPSSWAKLEWQYQQELNLCYVAATRAKRKLVLIEERNGEKDKEPVKEAA
jgi:superfamily I DNA/RNA helicase